jgi:hypothetical protein
MGWCSSALRHTKQQERSGCAGSRESGHCGANPMFRGCPPKLCSGAEGTVRAGRCAQRRHGRFALRSTPEGRRPGRSWLRLEQSQLAPPSHTSLDLPAGSAQRAAGVGGSWLRSTLVIPVRLLALRRTLPRFIHLATPELAVGKGSCPYRVLCGIICADNAA